MPLVAPVTHAVFLFIAFMGKYPSIGSLLNLKFYKCKENANTILDIDHDRTFLCVWRRKAIDNALLSIHGTLCGGNFLESRLEWWGVGFRNLVDSWGFGAGTGGFPKLVDPVPGAHSVYFGVLFDFGIIGFILFFSFLSFIVFKTLSYMKNIDDPELKFTLYCLFGALVTVSLHSLVDLDYTYPLLWFILGLQILVVKIAYHENIKMMK